MRLPPTPPKTFRQRLRGNRIRKGSPAALRAAMAAYARSIEYLDATDPRRAPTLPQNRIS
jgi:hypothetical protein